MSLDVTQVRGAVAAKLEGLGEVKVLLAPTKYQGVAEDLKLNVQIIIGSPSDSVEEAIDQLFDVVPAKLREDPELGGLVGDIAATHCSGHRLYQDGPDSPPQMGAEWTVEIVGD